jgi:hypothetical protein
VLEEVFVHEGSLIFPGVKLSQVIRRRPSAVSGEQWSYATLAHFDFVAAMPGRTSRTSRSKSMTRATGDEPDPALVTRLTEHLDQIKAAAD